MKLERVNYDDLEVLHFGQDMSAVLGWHGTPFTGRVYKNNDRGSLLTEGEYKDGYREGVQKGYFEDGRIRQVFKIYFSKRHGKRLEWFDNNRLKLEQMWELDILLWSKEYDESGNLIEEYNINDHHDRLKALHRARDSWKQQFEPDYRFDEAEELSKEYKFSDEDEEEEIDKEENPDEEDWGANSYLPGQQ